MNGESFELTVSLPHDARFAPMAAALAVHAAQSAGCCEAEACAFGRLVEEAVRGYVEHASPAAGPVPIVLRKTTGPVEAVIDGRTLRAGQ